MKTPFDLIESRLISIEALLLDLKSIPYNKQETNGEPELLTVSETAEFLRLSTSTVYTLISKGELPHMKR